MAVNLTDPTRRYIDGKLWSEIARPLMGSVRGTDSLMSQGFGPTCLMDLLEHVATLEAENAALREGVGHDV